MYCIQLLFVSYLLIRKASLHSYVEVVTRLVWHSEQAMKFIKKKTNNTTLWVILRAFITTFERLSYILFVKTFVFFLKSSDCWFSCIAEASIFSKFSTFISICCMLSFMTVFTTSNLSWMETRLSAFAGSANLWERSMSASLDVRACEWRF